MISRTEPESATSETSQSNTFSSRAIRLLLGLFCLCFLAGALRAATKNALWMDEVLAVWVGRLPSYHLVWSALFHGSETSPPTYHLFLHVLTGAFGGSYLLLRLPSILAALTAGWCLFALLRRYVDSSAAAYGTVFSLLGALSWFAVQARPYALVAACFAGAILLWDAIDSEPLRLWRVCAMSVLLACAIFLHFYATLLVPCIAFMELLWSALHRRLRLAVWAGLVLAGACSFVWLPLMRIDTRFNASDTGGLDYYAKPTLGKLTHAYSDLLIYDKKQILFLAASILLICTIAMIGTLSVPAKLRFESLRATSLSRNVGNLYVIAVCTLAFPLLVFVFAVVVTKTFNWRYCLIATFGLPCLLAYVLDRVPAFKPAAGAILLAACPFALLSSPQLSASVPDEVAVLQKASGPDPIVIGEGRLYFELEEALPRELKDRLVYVDAPAGAINPDPTNEHLVDRWRLIKPDLKVVKATDFFAEHPHFYVFHTSESTDTITPWLIQQHLIDKTVAEHEDALLFEAESP